MAIEKTTTPTFRVSYPNVFRARKNDLSGKDEYSVVAVFDPEAQKSPQYAAMVDRAKAAIVEKWGPDKAKWPQNLRSPFRKCEERMKDGKLPDGYMAGGIFVNLKSMQQPGVVDASVQPIIEPKDFYAGCYAIATVVAYPYDQKGNKGAAFGLRNIQKVKDGEPIAGASKPEDDFSPVAGAGAAAAAPASSADIFAQ